MAKLELRPHGPLLLLLLAGAAAAQSPRLPLGPGQTNWSPPTQGNLGSGLTTTDMGTLTAQDLVAELALEGELRFLSERFRSGLRFELGFRLFDLQKFLLRLFGGLLRRRCGLRGFGLVGHD